MDEAPKLMPASPRPASLQYGGENAAFAFAFDEPLSHLIYAGACGEAAVQLHAACLFLWQAVCCCCQMWGAMFLPCCCQLTQHTFRCCPAAACDVILVPSMFEPCGLTQVGVGRVGWAGLFGWPGVMCLCLYLLNLADSRLSYRRPPF